VLLQAKFFERIKIERKIEKLKREVAADGILPEAKAAAVGKLAEHEEDLQVFIVRLKFTSVSHLPSLLLFDKLLPLQHESPSCKEAAPP